MSAKLPSSVSRAAIALLFAILWAVGSVVPASAVVVTRSTGDVGSWETADTNSTPGARCRYEGAAGSFFLRSIRGNSVGIFGTESQERSVGYRLLLQHHTSHGWTTTQRGTLITGAATQSSPALLPRSRIRRDPDVSPNSGRYRLALKVVWYDQHANVQGVEVGYIQRHRRSFDDSVGASCRGQVPTIL
jgi:hypothetical protein